MNLPVQGVGLEDADVLLIHSTWNDIRNSASERRAILTAKKLRIVPEDISEDLKNMLVELDGCIRVVVLQGSASMYVETSHQLLKSVLTRVYGEEFVHEALNGVTVSKRSMYKALVADVKHLTNPLLEEGILEYVNPSMKKEEPPTEATLRELTERFNFWPPESVYAHVKAGPDDVLTLTECGVPMKNAAEVITRRISILPTGELLLSEGFFTYRLKPPPPSLIIPKGVYEIE